MPDLRKISRVEESKKEEDKPKPKKWFNSAAGGSNTFAQIMRQEMSKVGEKGPKKVDETQYKEI